jgi:hypothetical protein
MLRPGLLAPTRPESHRMLSQFGVMNTPADLVNIEIMFICRFVTAVGCPDRPRQPQGRKGEGKSQSEKDK